MANIIKSGDDSIKIKYSFFWVFVAVVIVFAGCTNITPMPSVNVSNTESPYQNIRYEEGIYHCREWERPVVNNSDVEDKYTDKDTAVSIAYAEIEKLQQNGIREGDVLQYIFFDTEDEVWVMSFYPNGNELYSTYQIAVSKQTGEILKMWAME